MMTSAGPGEGEEPVEVTTSSSGGGEEPVEAGVNIFTETTE